MHKKPAEAERGAKVARPDPAGGEDAAASQLKTASHRYANNPYNYQLRTFSFRFNLNEAYFAQDDVTSRPPTTPPLPFLQGKPLQQKSMEEVLGGWRRRPVQHKWFRLDDRRCIWLCNLHTYTPKAATNDCKDRSQNRVSLYYAKRRASREG